MSFTPRTRILLFALLITAPAARGDAETITLASYNIEHFNDHFRAHELTQKLPKEKKEDPDIKEMLLQLRKANDEDNWEAAQVIADRTVNPDILVIQEGCTQGNLEYFNKRWLGSAYGTVICFPTNTGSRNQHLNLLLKPGFKLLKRNDQYHLERNLAARPGDAADGAADRLFARGPAFVLVQAPSGYKLWVGVTHQKSKIIGFGREQEAEVRKQSAGQPKAAIDEKVSTARAAAGKATAEWRNREAKRTHEIMKELATSAESDDVILLGDMNDALGHDEYEKLAGADAIELLVGPKEDGFILETKPLADKGEISFGGYSRPDYRSLIDHVVTSPAMKGQVTDVRIFRAGVAPVASDHYPVVVKVRSDPATPNK